jgi:hypothetical protein
MDERPDLTPLARAHAQTHSFGGWRWLVAAPFVLAGIGGLGWADAPAILLKALIVLVLTAIVVGVLYLLFRKKMR